MMIIPQIQESIFHFLSTFIGKALQVDVTDTVATHAIPRNLINLNLFTNDIKLPGLLFSRPLDRKRHLRVWNTFQQFTYLVVGKRRDICCINSQNLIAGFQSGFCCRHSFKRLNDHDISLLITLTNISTDTTIFTCYHLLKVAHFLFGYIFCIWIQAT